MSRTMMQSLTLGVALGAAVMAGAVLVAPAGADRAVAPSEHGMAYVDVFALVDQIVMQPDPTGARAAFEAQGQQQLQTMQGEMIALQGQVQAADPQAPETAELYAKAQQLQQQMQQFYQGYQYDMQALIAGQIAQAYTQVYEAAHTIAAERAIPFVFATRPGSELMQTDSITGVAQEILARPLIAPPPSVDLTETVREKLGLPAPSEMDGSVLEGVMPEPAAEAPADTPAQTPQETPDEGGSRPDDDGADQPDNAGG